MRLVLSLVAPVPSHSYFLQKEMSSLRASWTTTTTPYSILTRPQRRTVSVASSSSSSPSKSSKLEPPDVRELAKMAQLEVTEEEVRRVVQKEKENYVKFNGGSGSNSRR